MKKTNKANKLLLNQETVRNLSASQLRSAAGGANTDSANSAGATRPGPSHDTDSAIANANLFANYANIAIVNVSAIG